MDVGRHSVRPDRLPSPLHETTRSGRHSHLASTFLWCALFCVNSHVHLPDSLSRSCDSRASSDVLSHNHRFARRVRLASSFDIVFVLRPPQSRRPSRSEERTMGIEELRDGKHLPLHHLGDVPRWSCCHDGETSHCFPFSNFPVSIPMSSSTNGCV